MYLSHALRAIVRTVVVTGDALWKYVTLLISGTPPAKTFIYDASNNNGSLTLNGDTRSSNFSPYTQGYYSNYFGGQVYAALSPASTNFNLTGDFTLEAWVYPTSFPGGDWGILDARVSGGSASAWLFGLNGAGKIQYYDGGSRLGATTVNTNTWNHVAWVRTGSVLRGYLNGVLDYYNGSYGSGAISPGSTSPYIGTKDYGIGPAWGTTGYISNLRVVNGTAVYTTSVTTTGTVVFTPSTAPLTAVANTVLLACQSNRLIDNSQNNFTITKNGDVSVRGFVPFAPPTSVNVNTLYSTTFDGSGDYLTAPFNSGYNFGTADFTIEFWVRTTSTAAYATALRLGDSWTTGSWALYLNDGGGTGYPSWWSFTLNQVLSTTGAVVNDGQWHHIAVVRSGSTVTMYIDGVSRGTLSVGTNSIGDTSTQLWIGRDASNVRELAGNISNLRIVKGTAVYTANFTPPTANLTAVANTSLLTCQDSTLKDNSANALTITSYGQAQPVLISPFTQTTTAVDTTYLGSGYFYDGGGYLGLPNSPGFSMGTGDFTIEAWIYTTSSGTQRIVSSAGNNFEFLLVNSGSNVYLNWYDGVSDTSTGSNYVPQNSWTHVAISRSGTSMRLFINGLISGTSTNSVNLPSNPQLFVGIYGGGNVNYFVGSISNLRIIKGQALYTANFAPPLQPLTAVANTQLLTLQTDQPAANKQFVDNSGSNLPITQAGNATQGTFSPYGSNWSNYFDGLGDWLTIPNNAGLAFGSGDFTIELWVNLSSSSGTIANYSNGQSAISNFAWELYQLSATSVQFSVFQGSSQYFSSSTAFTQNAWNHVAMVRNGTSLKTYVNGVAGATTGNLTGVTISDPAGATLKLCSYANGSYYTTGFLSNLRVVKGKALYTATFTPPTAPLEPIPNTTLLTCQSPSFVDNSLSALTVTRTGDVRVQRFSPFSPVTQTPVSYSAYFDGTGDYLSTSSSSFSSTGDLTIECWAYVTSASNYAGLVVLRPSSTAAGLGISILNTGYLEYAITDGSSGLYTGTLCPLNQWFHVALVRSGALSNNCSCYLNGVRVGQFTSTFQANAASNALVVGRYYTNLDNYYLNGYVSNLRYVVGTAVYTADFTPPNAPLTAIANTALLTCQSPVIVDNSSNALAITGYGNVVAKPFHPFGTTSYSQYFDGSGDYLETATTATAFALGTGDFTVEAWVYPLAYGGSVVGASIFGTTAGSYSGYSLNLGESQDRMRIVSNASGTWADNLVVSTGGGAPLNTWSHIAWVRSGNSMTIYKNGTSVATMTGVSAYNFTSPSNKGYAGFFWDGSLTRTLNGYISNLRVVKGTAVYTAAFTPPTAPLVVVSGTSLLTCQNLSAIDNSPNAFTITKSGNVSGSLNNPFPANAYTYTTGQSYTPALYGGSGYFDGTGDYLSIVNTPSLNLASVKFTIEAWVYINNYTNFNIVFAKRASSTTSFQCYIVQSTGIMAFQTGGTDIRSSTAVPLSQWCHLAWVYDGTNINQYLNGVRVNQTATSVTEQAVNIFVGYDNSGGSAAYLNGYIADVRVVKGDAVYVAGFIPPAAPLQAVKNTALLLNMDKAGVADSSRSNDFETVADAKIRYETPYAGSYYSNYFDGSGDYLTTPNNAALNPATGDFTIEAWVYLASLGTSKSIVSTYNNAPTGYWDWQVKTNNVLELSRDSGAVIITGATALTANTWIHVAVSRSGTSVKQFINGVLDTTNTSSGSLSSSNATAIGSTVNNINNFYGYISNLRLVKGTAVYTSAFTPPTAPLTAVANTSLLTCQSKSFVDNSTNNFTITKSGDTAVRAFNPFQATTYSSVYFDGDTDGVQIPVTSNFYLGTTYTIEAWVYNVGGLTYQSIFSLAENNTGGFAALQIFKNGSSFTASIRTATLGSEAGITGGTLVSNTWQHVALSVNAGSAKLFVGGVQVGTTTTFPEYPIAKSLYAAVGRWANGYTAADTNSWNGYIADLRITKAARYTATFTPPTAPLPTA